MPDASSALLIHTWIAFILVIGAIALFVQRLGSGGREWRWASGIAALFTLGALFNGMSFVDYKKEFSSAIMAGCWLTAVTALVTAGADQNHGGSRIRDRYRWIVGLVVPQAGRRPRAQSTGSAIRAMTARGARQRNG